MMSPSKLFFRRVSSELKFQFSVWRSAIDWTVALYIVLPAIALGINQYLLWWKNPPLWLNLLPVDLLFAICFFFAWSGTIRVFLREGDQLFLLNKTLWLTRIIKYGLIYSFSRDFIWSIFFILGLAPFIIQHYQFSNIHFMYLFFITFLSKIFLGLAKQLLTLSLDGWRQSVVVSGLMVLGGLVFITGIPNILSNSVNYVVTIVILFVAIGMLSLKRLSFKGAFFMDVAREQRERLKYVSFLLGFAGINIKKPRKQRQRPWLFPHSNLIFKKRNAVNGLVELCIKSTLRNRRSLSQYLQFVFICVLFIMSIPHSLKWLTWLILAFVFVNFVGLYWKESLASEFIQLFYWHPGDKQLALRKFLGIMALPGFLLISIAVGFQAFSWLGALLILPVSIGLVFYLSKVVAIYL